MRTRSSRPVITPSTPSEPTSSSRGARRERRRGGLAARGRQAHALDGLVDAPVSARGLTDRARRGATSDGGELETVGVVAEREVVLGKRRLEHRGARAGGDADGQRGPI